MVGDVLRAERERLGLTIKDIENETSIRAFYVEGIEKGDYASLPSEVYVRGFVKNYATFLKLDAEKILQQYREERSPQVEASPEMENAAETENSEKLFHSGEDFRERVQESHRSQNMVIVALVVILGFVGGIYYAFGDDPAEKPSQTAVTEQKKADKPKPAPAEKPQSPVKANAPEKKEPMPKQNAAGTAENVKKPAEEKVQQKPATANPVQPAPKPMAGKVNVGAVFSNRCWIQAAADGKTVYEGTVEKGQSLNWSAAGKVVVTVGNAGAVEFTHNGKSLGKAGKDGEVIESVFTATSVKKQ